MRLPDAGQSQNAGVLGISQHGVGNLANANDPLDLALDDRLGRDHGAVADHEVDLVIVVVVADPTVVPKKGVTKERGNGRPERLDLLRRQIDHDATFSPSIFMEAVGGEHRHVIGGRVEQIGMLQKHPDGDVLGIMRLVRRVLVADLHVGEQINALTGGLRLDDLEAAGIAQFRDAVQIAAQPLGLAVLGAGQQFLQRLAGDILLLVQQVDGEALVLALVPRQQRLHQGKIDGLDEPGVYELLQISGHDESPFLNDKCS